MKKNIINKWAYLIFILAVCTTLVSNAGETGDFQERINIEPHELLVIQNGLLLLKNNEVFPLNAVFADTDGLYVILEVRREDKIWDPNERYCENGHPLYCPCGGCANWWCTFRCKCHSPWSSKE